MAYGVVVAASDWQLRSIDEQAPPSYLIVCRDKTRAKLSFLAIHASHHLQVIAALGLLMICTFNLVHGPAPSVVVFAAFALIIVLSVCAAVAHHLPGWIGEVSGHASMTSASTNGVPKGVEVALLVRPSWQVSESLLSLAVAMTAGWLASQHEYFIAAVFAGSAVVRTWLAARTG